MPSRLLFPGFSRTARARLRAYYRSLEARHGAFDATAHAHAMATTQLWWTFKQASEAFGAAERRRNEGKGRRPSEKNLERLMKRQGLAFGTWQEAERGLEQLASRAHRTPETPAELLAGIARENRG